MSMKKWFCILMASVLCVALFGCAKQQPKSSTSPAPTLPSNDKISITGKVELAISADNDTYTVTCTSNIPDGAFVDIYLLDDAGNMLDFTGDVISKNGKCTASFDVDSAKATAKANKAQGIVARVEFFPSNKVQPIGIQEKFGAKGSKLAGDNVIRDETTSETGVRMESSEKSLI